MIQRRSTFFLGFFIFLIPFLGFPSSWKIVLTVLSGVTLMGLSVKITLPKKIVKRGIKPVVRRNIKKEKPTALKVKGEITSPLSSEFENISKMPEIKIE